MHSGIQRLASGLLAVLATGTLAAALTAPVEPCASISALYAQADQFLPFNIPGQLAHSCLLSMPLESDKAVQWIDEYTKYIQFQSDIETLAKPPATYLSGPVDLLALLGSIRSRAQKNLYTSQYEFDEDIQNLIASTNDGHLSVSLCSLSVFIFYADVSFVSLSPDGVTTPRIYTDGDALLLAEGGTTDVSPLAFINGVGAAATIEDQSSRQGLQDPDARYNNMLSNLAVDGQGNSISGAWPNAGLWPGYDNYNLTFANGTIINVPVNAQLISAFDEFNFADGKAFYDTVCNLQPQPSPSSSPSTPATSAVPSPPAPPTGYPTPVMREPYNTIVGYYPDEDGLEDVAVLGVPTFETAGDDIPESTYVDFAVTAEWFVQNATRDGKKKIIIDLQNNGGGVVESGFALLSVFFPNETIYSGTRFRAHDAMNFIGTIYNAQDNSQNPSVNGSGLYVPDLVKPDQVSTFKSWKDLFGPYNADGIPSSALLAEFDFTDDANPVSNPINTEGLGGPLDARTPPFAPEDIVILTDGRCSSTCTIFSDHMVSKGVRTVAMGGRPRPGPMQAIGGVKGSQVLQLSDIESAVTAAQQLLNASQQAGQSILSKESLTLFEQVMPIPLADFPLPISGSVNYRNTYSQADDQTPTQFIYEAADCHLFYTPETLVNPAITWALAANATWGSGTCVGGVQSSSNTSSRPSGNGELANGGPGTSDKTINSAVRQPGAFKALGLLLALGSGMNRG